MGERERDMAVDSLVRDLESKQGPGDNPSQRSIACGTDETLVDGVAEHASDCYLDTTAESVYSYLLRIMARESIQNHFYTQLDCLSQH